MILPFVTIQDNAFLVSLPSFEEIQEVVFSVDAHSAPSPDGISGAFSMLVGILFT